MNATINYDKKHDILYFRPSVYIPSYGDEDDEGVVTLRSIEDDTPIGMIINDFKERISDGSFANLSLPFVIDLNDPFFISKLN